jgi:hypothetical protein
VSGTGAVAVCNRLKLMHLPVFFPVQGIPYNVGT